MKYVAKTDVGLVRTNNEDSYLIGEIGDVKIFIVADGMGGHNAGEVASLEACRKVESYILGNQGEAKDVLKAAVECANREIFIHASQNEAMRGMGTTIEAALFKEDNITLAHVGDSSVFIISKDSIKKITKDHSVVGEMVDNGTITIEEARRHPQRHFITRAVGTAFDIEVDIVSEKLKDGEIVLMCSDGLTDMVTPEEILDAVNKSESLDKAAEALLKEAKDHGGADNITLILFGSDSVMSGREGKDSR